MKPVKIIFVLIILFSNIFTLLFAGDVFVVSDVYGILPDGTCRELFVGDFGALKEKNGQWDAASQTIKMFAAKNEEVAVQIVIPQRGNSYWGKMSSLSGPGEIPPDRATFSAMAWVNHVELGMCPDLVLPLDGSVNNITRFDIPISFNGIPNPQNSVGVMLFEVWVPKEIPAGIYQGTVSIMEKEKEFARLTVELTVFDFTLPDMPTFAFELLNYGMPSIAFNAKAYINPKSGLGQPAAWTPEATKKIDYQVYKLAMDNRCYVNSMLYSSQRGHPRYAYPVEGEGKNARIMSYEEWDDFFGPILDGKVNKFGEPPPHFMLPFNINYPYNCESQPEKQFDFTPYKSTVPDGPGKEKGLEVFEESFRSVARQYVAHFAEKGWTKTQFEVYFNQKPAKDRNRTPWKLDEPTSLDDYKGLRYLFSVSKWAFEPFATENGIQVVNRLDIGHFNCDRFATPDAKLTKCYKSKDYNRKNADLYLKNWVDHWVISRLHYYATQYTHREYEGPGRKLINYSSTGSSEGIGQHYGQFAGEGFLAARVAIVGRVLFRLGLKTADPNNQEAGSYKGNTFYNGMSMGFSGALPSHRLKLWRNSVNDYDYILLARGKDEQGVKDILNKMVKIGPTPSRKYRKKTNPMHFWFNNNVEDILRARLKLVEIITGQKITAEEIEGFSDDYTPCGSEDRIVGYD
ncbi:MAG: hypothetical protein ACE5GL_04780 [Calditrichia bacterium]